MTLWTIIFPSDKAMMILIYNKFLASVPVQFQFALTVGLDLFVAITYINSKETIVGTSF